MDWSYPRLHPSLQRQSKCVNSNPKNVVERSCVGQGRYGIYLERIQGKVFGYGPSLDCIPKLFEGLAWNRAFSSAQPFDHPVPKAFFRSFKLSSYQFYSSVDSGNHFLSFWRHHGQRWSLVFSWKETLKLCLIGAKVTGFGDIPN